MTASRKRKLAMARVAFVSALALCGSALAAQPGTASIMADNGALMVLETNANYQIVQPSVGSDWPTIQTFQFDLPNSLQDLANCRIHIIAWGDGTWLQGVMAHFNGSRGYTFTGQPGSPLNIVRQSSVTFIGGPSNARNFANNGANAQAIVMGTPMTNAPPQFLSAPLAGGASQWGTVAMPAVPDASQVRFVWNGDITTLDSDPANYRVVTMPCLTIADEVPNNPPPPPPTAMTGDHFQCYPIRRSANIKAEEITIMDQFGRSQVVLGRAVQMCNPAVKVHRGKTYEVEREERHLVCYAILRKTGGQDAKVVETDDQFAKQRLALRDPSMVCVPAAKRRIDRPDLPLK